MKLSSYFTASLLPFLKKTNQRNMRRFISHILETTYLHMMTMKHKHTSMIKKIDETINYCFTYIPDIEVNKFIRKLNNESSNHINYYHTLRELILGAYLSKNGFDIQLEYQLDSKTPDWSIIGNNSLPQCIIELFTFNPDSVTSEILSTQVKNNAPAWSYFVKPNINRLYEDIRKKASIYKAIVTKYNLQYVISIFSGPIASIKQSELDECLLTNQTGIFEIFPEVSGVLLFENVLNGYSFSYNSNPRSKNAIEIPSGKFLIPK